MKASYISILQLFLICILIQGNLAYVNPVSRPIWQSRSRSCIRWLFFLCHYDRRNGMETGFQYGRARICWIGHWKAGFFQAGKKPSWAVRDFWAPQIHVLDSNLKYILLQLTRQADYALVLQFQTALCWPIHR